MTSDNQLRLTAIIFRDDKVQKDRALVLRGREEGLDENQIPVEVIVPIDSKPSTQILRAVTTEPKRWGESEYLDEASPHGLRNQLGKYLRARKVHLKEDERELVDRFLAPIVAPRKGSPPEVVWSVFPRYEPGNLDEGLQDSAGTTLSELRTRKNREAPLAPLSPAIGIRTGRQLAFGVEYAFATTVQRRKEKRARELGAIRRALAAKRLKEQEPGTRTSDGPVWSVGSEEKSPSFLAYVAVVKVKNRQNTVLALRDLVLVTPQSTIHAALPGDWLVRGREEWFHDEEEEDYDERPILSGPRDVLLAPAEVGHFRFLFVTEELTTRPRTSRVRDVDRWEVRASRDEEER